MAGPARFWCRVFRVSLVVAVASAVWAAGSVEAKTRRPAATAPMVGRASVDLGYGARVRGGVTVVARVRGGRLVATVTGRRLVLPVFRARHPGRLVVWAAVLCGGRLGASRSVASALLAAPSRVVSLSFRPLSLPARCKPSLPLGLFFRVQLVSSKPSLVLHSVSGSIPALSRGGASHA